MPDNRIEIEIAARNQTGRAFRDFQSDLRQSNRALEATSQTARQGANRGIRVYRDELGKFHEEVSGRFIGAARVAREGLEIIERSAKRTRQGGIAPLRQELLSLGRQSKNFSQAFADDFSRAFNRPNQALQRLRDGLKRYGADVAQVTGRLRNEYQHLRTDIGNVASVFNRFSAVLTGHVRSQFNEAANLERLGVALRTISGSTEAAAEQYKRLLEAARLPGINLENSLRASLQLQAIGKTGQEATIIIKEFGNAFALAGGSGQQLAGVVHGIRQIISDGTVLQRELNIITSRIAILTPIMKEAFGGNRAEDVRAFAKSIGRGDDVVGVFFETILAGLKELPRAGDTAANAIENLIDSYDRAQAAIGTHFIPLVREGTALLEGFLLSVERADPDTLRLIASVSALGTAFVATTGAVAAFIAIAPALGAAFANPVGLLIIGVAAVAAGIVGWRIATQEATPAFEDAADATSRLADAQGRLRDTDTAQGLNTQRRATQEAAHATDEAADATSRLADAQGRLRDTDTAQGLNTQRRATQEAAHATDEAADATSRLADAQGRLRDTDTAQGLNTQRRATQEAAHATDEAADATENIDSKLQDLTETTRTAAKATDDYTDARNRQREADSAAAREIDNARESINADATPAYLRLVEGSRALSRPTAATAPLKLVNERDENERQRQSELRQSAFENVEILQDLNKELGEVYAANDSDALLRVLARIREELRRTEILSSNLSASLFELFARTRAQRDPNAQDFLLLGGPDAQDPRNQVENILRGLAENEQFTDFQRTFDPKSRNKYLPDLLKSLEGVRLELERLIRVAQPGSRKAVLDFLRVPSVVGEARDLSGRDAVEASESIFERRGGGTYVPQQRFTLYDKEGNLDPAELERRENVEAQISALEELNNSVQELAGSIDGAAQPSTAQTDILGNIDKTARQPIPIVRSPLNVGDALSVPASSGRRSAQAGITATDSERFVADLESRFADANQQISGSNLETLNLYRDEAIRVYESIGEARTLAELDSLDQILIGNATLFQTLAGYQETEAVLFERFESRRQELLNARGAAVETASAKQQLETDEIFRSESEAFEKANQDYASNYDARRIFAQNASKARRIFAQNASKAIADGQARLLRLQGQEADAFSRRQLERLQHETAQSIALYQSGFAGFTTAQRKALVDNSAAAQRQYETQVQNLSNLIRDLNVLHADLGEAIEEAFRAERIERFREGVEAVVQDLASVTLDHVFDSLTGSTDRATDALAEYSYQVAGAQQAVNLLVGDVTRLDRLQEDSSLRGDRLQEDRDRRIAQLRRQQQTLASRAPTGDQRGIERNIQRQQDLRFRISELREDFGVRIARQQEDFTRRRDRLIEDSVARRDRQPGQSLGSELGDVLENAVKRALAAQLAGYLTGRVFDKGISLVTAALGALGIKDAIGGLLGRLGIGGGDGEGEQDGTTALTGTLTIPKENITLPEGALALKGEIALAAVDITLPTDALALKGTVKAADITLPTEVIDLTGKISTIDPLADSVRRPPVPGLTGGIARIVLEQGVDRPIVPGLTGEIDSLSIKETLEDLPTVPELLGIIGGVEFGEDFTEPDEGVSGLLGTISSIALAADATKPTVAGLTGEITSLSVAQATVLPSVNVAGIINSLVLEGTIPAVTGLTGKISTIDPLADSVRRPPVPGLTGGIARIVLEQGVDRPIVPGLTGQISKIAFAEDIDAPNLAQQELTIASVAFAEGVAAPALGAYDAVIDSITFSEDIDYPSLHGFEALITSVRLASGVALPNLTPQAAATEDPQNPPSTSVDLIGRIASAILDPDIDIPTVTGMDGRIDSITIATDLPTIRIAATAVVGAVTGGQGGETQFGEREEDPENPMLGIDPSLNLDNITQPVALDGIINARLNLLFDQPIVLQGRIDATVNYLTGANVDQGDDENRQGGGGGADDPVQRSQIGEDISAIARTLSDAVVSSGNLDPALGDTQWVSIPDILDKLNQQTNFSDDQALRENPGFGDILRSINQFRPSGGGAGGQAGSGSLRVTFPPEVLVTQLAQETTLQAGFIFANEHLSALASVDFATEATLDKIATATERTAAVPIVDALLEVGLAAIPTDPSDPTNQLLTDFTSTIGGAGAGLLFDIQTAREYSEGSIMRGDVDMSLMPGSTADNPGFCVACECQ